MKTKDRFWLPINLWNLNEVFTTESISPISFYKIREFGNPVNRNQEIEDENNLILYKTKRKSNILIEIGRELLDEKDLQKIKENEWKYVYPKTIYLRKGLFKVYFASRDILNEFRNNTFLLLEVKTINKYYNEDNQSKSSLVIDEKIKSEGKEVIYKKDLLFFGEQKMQPFFDKAFNQIKGLIYGYLIGSIGSLDDKEQGFVTDLTNLKNSIGGIHTDIVLLEQYSNLWLRNIRKQIKDCSKGYFEVFNQNTTVFDMLLLRLEEIDNLNKMRCNDLDKQKKTNYKREYEQIQEDLEKLHIELYKFESKYNITSKREELQKIKNQEKQNGRCKSKEREYFKKGTEEYDRKRELKQIIEEFETNSEYAQYKEKIEQLEEQIKSYQFGYTQYDTSINEQFNRISEYIHDLVRKVNDFFISKNNKTTDFPDISFGFDMRRLSKYYSINIQQYTDFSIQLPKVFVDKFSENEQTLLNLALNSVLSFPQGRLGNYSEQNILDILINIGKELPDSSEKTVLREYYKYRKAETDTFNFPENQVLANLIVFLIKLQGHEQINKMLVAKNVTYKQIAFMFYGAYVGFANMPKTFTNIIFGSNNENMFEYIDNYLFSNYLK
ncbi:hypothetical protein EZS27_023657 [termite gut metagenome]|uniref:Uncharacterized protein n=1 Tax=termite gut metagenome TaxID=433724 RepID=A0A5J4R199_9ZZZZ